MPIFFVIRDRFERHCLVHTLNTDVKATITENGNQVRPVSGERRTASNNEIEKIVIELIFCRQRRPVYRFEAPEKRKVRSEEHTSELQSLMRNSYAGFCLQHNS